MGQYFAKWNRTREGYDIAAVREGLAQNDAGEKRLVIAYLVVQAILLLLIKACEAFSLGRLTNIAQYASVIFGSALAMYFFTRYGRRAGNERTNIIVAGLATTALADLFLMLIDTDWSILPGFVLFCVTQAIYGMYLGLNPRASIGGR